MPLPPNFFSVNSYDLKSMSFKFGNDIFITFEMPRVSYIRFKPRKAQIPSIPSICNQRSLSCRFLNLTCRCFSVERRPNVEGFWHCQKRIQRCLGTNNENRWKLYILWLRLIGMWICFCSLFFILIGISSICLCRILTHCYFRIF